VPQRVLWEEDAARQSADLRELGFRGKEQAAGSSGGVMPEDLLQQMTDAKWELRLPEYPSIPQWLYEQPVFGAYFVPNGDIVTQGELGCRPPNADELTWEEQWTGCSGAFSATTRMAHWWTKYLTDSGDWLQLVFSLLRRHRAPRRQQRAEPRERDGFLLLRDSESGELLQAFDFDGTPLD